MRHSTDRLIAAPAPTPVKLAVAALACGLLAACGAASAATGGIAAASAAPAPSSAPSEAPTAAKPPARSQLRLDSTAAEVRKYRLAYATCLKEHGMPSKGIWPEKAEKAARRACESLRPLLPPELDPKQNPHYAESVRIEAGCLRDHGFDVHLVPPTGSDPNTISWRYESVPGPDVDIEKIQDDCRVKAFGGGRAIRPGPA
ncbi:hypothetical protein ACSDR0_14515 [Streptosporangium sp. G11]|uniref:hypothetical protein n=1 Tax=Streptosporangium sp. G11 TaxID=3436926 RepID=UPI003EBE2199